MAKVEMSLVEYDALKAELDTYKEIVSAIFKYPEVSDWALNKYNEGVYNDVSVETRVEIKNLSSNAQFILSDYTQEAIKSLDIDGEFKQNKEFTIRIGDYVRIMKETESNGV